MAASRRTVLAAALLVSAAGQETPGCFYHPFSAPTISNPYEHGVYIYRDPNVTTWVRATSAVKCQALCAAQSNCSVFTYYADTSGCWLQGASATLDVVEAGTKFGAGTVAGPKVCPQVPDRCGPSAVPQAGFPETVQDAFPENFQPRKSVCWKADRSSLDPVFSPCLNTTVVQYLTGCDWKNSKSTPKGLLGGKSCRARCDEDPECAAYEEDANYCFTGIGLNCTVLPSAVNATGARLQRGDVRTIYSWTKKEFVAGAVVNVGWISKQYFAKAFDISAFSSVAAAKTACQQVCQSSLNCEFWQLSSEKGCFVDTTDAYYQLVYPLTASAFNGSSPDTIIAGEYIQHRCSSTGVPTGVPEVPTAEPTVAPVTTAPAVPVAHVTFEGVNLDYAAIPADKQAPLIAKYKQDVATTAGIPADLVEVGLRPGTPRAEGTSALSSASTFIDTHIQVPAGKTVSGIEAALAGNVGLFSGLSDSTKAVLGLGSPAILGAGLTFRNAVAPTVPPTEASSGGVPWWVWLLVALAALLVAGCIAAYALGACDEGKRKKSSKSSRRRRDREAADEEMPAVEVPLVGASAAAPVPTVAEPVPMYSSGVAPAVYSSGTPVYTTGSPSVVLQPVQTLQPVPVYSTGAPVLVPVQQPVVMTAASPILR